MKVPLLFNVSAKSRQPDLCHIHFCNDSGEKVIVTRKMLQENNGNLPKGISLAAEFYYQGSEVKNWTDFYYRKNTDVYVDDKGKLNPYYFEKFEEGSWLVKEWKCIEEISFIIVSEQVYLGICDAQKVGRLKVEWDAALPLHVSPFDKGLRRRKGNIPFPPYYALALKKGIEGMDSAPIEEQKKLPKMFKDLLYLALRKETWNKTDFFMRPNGYPACSIRFIELAREHRWKDFIFTPLEVPFSSLNAIPYLGRGWPPKVWYPSDFDENDIEKFWNHEKRV